VALTASERPTTDNKPGSSETMSCSAVAALSVIEFMGTRKVAVS
jgi:hypothetical protein